MAGYCRCGVTLHGGCEGLCPECYPLSKADAERQDREADRLAAAAQAVRASAEEGPPGGRP